MSLSRRDILKTSLAVTSAALAGGCTLHEHRSALDKRGGQLFQNGTIYLDADTRVSNLLVKDGVVIGYNVPAAHIEPEDTVDLRGTALYPGFNDSPVHLVSLAVAKATGVYLSGASTAAEIARIVGDHCSRLPADVPVLAYGFVLQNYDAWSLDDLKLVDEATGNRPVMIADQLGHSYIANSAALTLSQVDGTTKAPLGGAIIVQDGKPTGMLRETAGYLVGNKAIFPRVPDAILKVPVQQLFDQWSAMGYTSIIELMGGPMGRILKPGVCMELEREGRLPMRTYYAHTFFSLEDIEGFREAPPDTELVRFAGLKLFVDGAAGNGGAWTSWENTQNGHGLHAVMMDDSEGEQYNIHRIVDRAEGLGLDMHYHVGGDLSIEVVLAAIEGVKAKAGTLRTKHTLYHLGFLTDNQIQRMKRLGSNVIAGIQPSLHWEYSKQITIDFYGKHANGAYPYRKMRDAGLVLAHGTDFASNRLELCSPTVIMKAALTGGGDPVARPPLTMRDMIQGFTVGGFATTQEKRVGTLHLGQKADMVVFSRDLYTVPPEELGANNPKVLATYLAGKQVYSHPAS